MRSLFLIFVVGVFLSVAFRFPYIGGLGYVWIEYVAPQKLGWGFIQSLPISLMAGALTFFAYLIADRKDPPKPNLLFWLLCIWVLYFTMSTMFWAELPADAWLKWDKAIKAIGFCIFLTFLVRTRIQIEAFILVLVLSVAVWTASAGAKALLGGLSYGSNALAIGGRGSDLYESSNLAMVAVLVIPLCLWLRRFSVLTLWKGRISDLFFFGLIAASILTTVGSYARTGLVALAVLGFSMIMMSRYRFRVLTVVIITAVIGFQFAPQTYKERMLTITNYEEDKSASGRVIIWLWAMQYAKDHPLGGGFWVFKTNNIRTQALSKVDRENGELDVSQFQRGDKKTYRSAHSIYFEVLGEQGFPGLLIYISIIFTALASLWRLYRRNRNHETLYWLSELARNMMFAVLVYAAGGAFINIAYQSFFYLLVMLTISLNNVERREREKSLGSENVKPKFTPYPAFGAGGSQPAPAE
ncbi:MAG: putative O-glycosylation ligase, exosortase A system-associated [Pseudomonadota bacterium]